MRRRLEHTLHRILMQHRQEVIKRRASSGPTTFPSILSPMKTTATPASKYETNEASPHTDIANQMDTDV